MAAAADLAILDGRYQVLRQIGGPPNAPLMLASDLRRGVVVCVRLRRFSTAMARLAAVPRLAQTGDGRDGPLLPFDFGVDGDIAYLARPYAVAVSLEARLADAAPLPPLDALRLVTAAGQALLGAEAQGFPHPGLGPRHVLITAAGHVCLAGYDRLGPAPMAAPADGNALAALLRATLGRQPTADLPEALRRLLVALATWERRGFPPLAATVRELARVEARLSGAAQPALALRTGGRAMRGAWQRIWRLGPLLRPYLIIGGLLAGTAALSAGALSARGGPNQIVVYAVAPAPAAIDPTPRPITVAAAVSRPTVTSIALTTSTLAVGSRAVSERANPPLIAPQAANAASTLAPTADAAPAADARGTADGSRPAPDAPTGSTQPRVTAADRAASADRRPASGAAQRGQPIPSASEARAVTPSQARSTAAATPARITTIASVTASASIGSRAETASAITAATAASSQVTTTAAIRSTQATASTSSTATRGTTTTTSASASAASTRVAASTSAETSRTAATASTRAAR